MKSNIPWGSPCMRRFGTSIRKQIQEVGSQVVLGTFRAQLYAKQHVTTMIRSWCRALQVGLNDYRLGL